MGLFNSKKKTKGGSNAPKKKNKKVNMSGKKAKVDFNVSVFEEVIACIRDNTEFTLAEPEGTYLIAMLPLEEIGDPRNKDDEMYGNFVNQANSGEIICFVNKMFLQMKFITVVPTVNSLEHMLELGFDENFALHFHKLSVNPDDISDIDFDEENSVDITLGMALAVAKQDALLESVTDGVYTSVEDVKALADYHDDEDEKSNDHHDEEDEFADDSEYEFDSDFDDDDNDFSDNSYDEYEDAPEDLAYEEPTPLDETAPTKFIEDREEVEQPAENPSSDEYGDTEDLNVAEAVASAIVLNKDLGLTLNPEIFNQAITDQIAILQFNTDRPVFEPETTQSGYEIQLYNHLNAQLNEISQQANADIIQVREQKVAGLWKHYLSLVNVSVKDMEKLFSDDPESNSTFYQQLERLNEAEENERAECSSRAEEKLREFNERIEREIQAARETGATVYEQKYHEAHDVMNDEQRRKIEQADEIRIETKFRDKKSKLYEDRKMRASQMYAERIPAILEYLQEEMLAVNDAESQIFAEYSNRMKKIIDDTSSIYHRDMSKISASLDVQKRVEEVEVHKDAVIKSLEEQLDAEIKRKDAIVAQVKQAYEDKYDTLKADLSASRERENDLRSQLKDASVQISVNTEQNALRVKEMDASLTERIKRAITVGIAMILIAAIAGLGIGFSLGSSSANQNAIEALTESNTAE